MAANGENIVKARRHHSANKRDGGEAVASVSLDVVISLMWRRIISMWRNRKYLASA